MHTDVLFLNRSITNNTPHLLPEFILAQMHVFPVDEDPVFRAENTHLFFHCYDMIIMCVKGLGSGGGFSFATFFLRTDSFA